MIFKTLESIDSAKAKMFDVINRKGIESETIDITEAFGRILAEDVISNENIPGFTRTAMDGYALICSDVQGASEEHPVNLKFIGEVSMGHAPDFTIGHGQCAYVPTGGMMPAGADGIVIIEDTSCGGDIPSLGNEDIYVGMYSSPKPGKHLVDPNEDVSEGEIVLPKGKKLRAQEIGTLAALGHKKVTVFKQLTMAIISTGDELVGIDGRPEPGKVRDINSYTMMGIAQKYGMKVTQMSLLEDKEDLLESTVKEAIQHADIVAASGGSSVGKKDATARIFDKISNPGIFVHGIAMKPGKPTILGYDEPTSTILVGVPGHPASAMMSFEMIVMEAINQYMTGKPAEESEFVVPAVLTGDIKAQATRDTCITLSLTNDSILKAMPVNKKSGAITMLSHADGYVLLRAGEERKAGETVRVHLF